MNDIGLFIGFLVLIVFAIFALWESPEKKNELSENEKNCKKIFMSKNLSGSIGLWAYNGPFIKLILYETFIIIETFTKKYVMYLSDIIEVKKKWPNRILFKHNSSNIPSRFIITNLEKKYFELLVKQIEKIKSVDISKKLEE